MHRMRDGWERWGRGACLVAAVVLGGVAATSASAAVFYGPTPYLSAADIPLGFYAGLPAALENFEDGSLDFGISASAGSVNVPSTYTDSVDGDDGIIDGLGRDGHSWYHFPSGTLGVVFTFNGPLPTAAGLVWTDGDHWPITTFEAFGPGMVSLGSITAPLGDNFHDGHTAEDRFFGVQDAGGILAIKISQSGWFIEVDHVQYGAAPTRGKIPEPSTLALLGLGALGFLGRIGRRPR